MPKCPHADLFNRRGRAWLGRQVLPDNQWAAIATTSARSIAWPKIWLTSIATSPGKRLMTCKPTASDDHRRQRHRRERCHRRRRRHPAVPRTAEANELLRPQSACALHRSWLGAIWADQQTWAFPCPRHAEANNKHANPEILSSGSGSRVQRQSLHFKNLTSPAQLGTHYTALDRWAGKIDLISRNAASPSGPSSRPRPLSLTPPNGASM